MLDGFPIIRDAFARTVRLVSTARLRPSVLRSLVDSDAELEKLFDIEAATSNRLVAQERGFETIDPNEFVYDVPHSNFINAAFAYAKPSELQRFNGPGRGTWYAALEVETCLQEVKFHMTDFLSRTGDYNATVDYAEMFASLAGEYVDMRNCNRQPPALHPDPSIGYPAGNVIADAARARGLNGIIYPSVRHEGGVCFAVLRPHAVQSVAPGDIYRVEWQGSPDPSVSRITNA